MNVEYIDHMGSDLTVVNAARVSMDKHHDELDLDADPKLIRYLARHEHWTPFAHAQVQLRISVPIFVSNQLKRHQIGFALNEVSRRYVSDEPEFGSLAWRKKPDKSVKQGSGAEFSAEEQLEISECYQHALGEAKNMYGVFLRDGVAPEQARAILPQSMYTSFYWTGSLYAWARLCGQRLDSHAQGETRQVAEKIAKIIHPLFPHSWPILLESTRVRMAAHDMRALLKKWVAVGVDSDDDSLRQEAERLLVRVA